MIRLIMVISILLVSFNLCFAGEIKITQEKLDRSPLLRFWQDFGTKFKDDIAMLKKGDKVFYAKKYKDAIEIYESFFNKHPEFSHGSASHNLANCYDYTGFKNKADITRKKAIENGKKLIEKYKNDPYIGIVDIEIQRFYLEMNHLSDEDLQEAVKYSEEYIDSRKKPKAKWAAYLRLGELYAKKGYWKESINQYEEVYKLSRSNKSEKDWDTYETDALVHMAEAYLNLGDKAKALASLKKLTNKDLMVQFAKYKEIRKSFSKDELMEIEPRGRKP